MSIPSSVQLIEQLSNAFGISGFEDEVQDLILSLVEPYIDEYHVDALGNLIVTKHGTSEHVVMVDSHMDEIGFMVSHIEENGFLRFTPTSGWDPRVVPAHRMTVRTEDGVDVRGVVGTQPPHLSNAEERQKPYRIEDLFIDVGARNADEVRQLGVAVGDPAVIHYPFEQLTGQVISGKALDDRAGCAVAIELLARLQEEPADLSVVVAFTSREEIGGLGAKTAAYQIEPDVALVLEATLCADVPGSTAARQITRMGHGPAITLMDNSQIVRPEVARLLRDLAEEESIPYQYKTPPFGGTDGGAIQTVRAGVLSATLSVPCRYVHSPASILHLDDYHRTVDLATLFVRRCGRLVS